MSILSHNFKHFIKQITWSVNYEKNLFITPHIVYKAAGGGYVLRYECHHRRR